MKEENYGDLSVRRLAKQIYGMEICALLLLMAGVFIVTGRGENVLLCLATAGLLLPWNLVLMGVLQKKLSYFTNALCRTMDQMVEGKEIAVEDFFTEEETLLARMLHKMSRLYDMTRHQKERAERERETLQQIISDISNQTRTPITNLKMLNETLRETKLRDSDRQEFLRAAGSQIDKLDFLFLAMVKMSRLETGMITLRKKDAPLYQTLAEAIGGVIQQAGKKEIQVSARCDEDLSLPHDPKWTAEALFNILDNVVKYTPRGGRVRVETDSWEFYVKIDITDTGRGISERNQAAVFKRFYREEGVGDLPGAGIGLCLTREIISRQGGYVQVASKPGQGSVFSVFLPKHRS